MKSKALKRAVIIVLAFAMLVPSVCLPSCAALRTTIISVRCLRR